MVRDKRKSLILDFVSNKKLNAIAGKTVDINKELDIAANKKLNSTADKASTLIKNKGL